MNRRGLCFAIALWLVPARAVAQQDIGHKTLGTQGLHAGDQAPTGLYLVNAVATYRANALVDRNGNDLPVGIDLDALFGAFGVAFAYEVPQLSTYVNVAVSLPMAHATINTTRPEASIDRFGLGDLFVQPMKLGWKTKRFDVVAAYAFYAPTGEFEPGGSGGVGRGHWTHEVSLGGTIAFDAARTWRLSAMTSVDVNERKQNIDITRGATVQIQGGFGYTAARIFDAGVIGYALWQVTDDQGSDLPPLLRGARDTAYGIGPEIDLRIPACRCSLMARYAHDFAVESRPRGEIFIVTLTSAIWSRQR